MPASTKRSASSCMVHFTWSSGGALQVMAIRYASPLSSSFGLTPRRGHSLSAWSSPPSTYFLRVRSTVERPTPTLSAISASCLPASASRNSWARASLRAAMVPFFSKPVSLLRSSSVNCIWYCFLGIDLSSFRSDFTQYVSICQIPCGHLLVQLSIYVRGYDAQCQFEKLYETENLFQASLLITQLVCYI